VRRMGDGDPEIAEDMEHDRSNIEVIPCQRRKPLPERLVIHARPRARPSRSRPCRSGPAGRDATLGPYRNRGVEGVGAPSLYGLGCDAGPSDLRSKPKVGDHGAGHQMDGNVKPADRNQSERVLDEQAKQAQEQQDDPEGLQVRASAR
jgi:hypothetical protein